MKDLFGVSNKAKHREAREKVTKEDLHIVGYDFEAFTAEDAAYLFNRNTGEFTFQHFGNKEAAIEALKDAIKGARR